MPASETQIKGAWADAQLALLEKFNKAVEEGYSPGQLKDLAETYAWLVSPAQDH